MTTKTTTMEVTVVIEKTIQVTLRDEALTGEALEEFSGYMFDVSDPEDLFAYAATQLAKDEWRDSIEGIGDVGTGHQYPVTFRVLYEDISTEVNDTRAVR